MIPLEFKDKCIVIKTNNIEIYQEVIRLYNRYVLNNGQLVLGPKFIELSKVKRFFKNNEDQYKIYIQPDRTLNTQPIKSSNPTKRI